MNPQRKKIILFTFVLLIIGVLLQVFIPHLMPGVWTLELLFFFLLSMWSAYFLDRGKGATPLQFAQRMQILSMVRIFTSIGIFLIFILTNRSQAISVAVCFLAFYFLFAIFETIVLRKR